ncbi:MAG: aminoacetone oxidase family FAD-binding enzyme [Eggerthellaceae bacterium]|nr:aminoacetone oxidase family FAD-binding enzyme [Eggerthellaceae bacterium]
MRYHEGMKRIAVIGGGAAGLAAAVSAAQAAQGGSVEVTVFEKADRVGKSILASGNGRCNFSNSTVDAASYHNPSFVQASFDALPPSEALGFYAALGLIWREEGEGRLYPLSGKASSVLDVLRFAARDLGVEVRCGREVRSVTPANGALLVCLEDDTASFFDAAIVACGGMVARSLMPTGYRYLNTQPMLGPLRTSTEAIRGLNNVRVRCNVSCGGHEETGEILFRDYGLSGIAVFNLSRFAHAGDTLTIDFLPQFSFEEAQGLLEQRFSQFPRRGALDSLAGMLQQPLARAVLKAAGLSLEAPLEPSGLAALTQALKGFSLAVEGMGDPQQCQVWRGGFDTGAFSPGSLESKSDPGLYVVGEALDVDGPCGGYNLHWAWTSGILAGQSAARG